MRRALLLAGLCAAALLQWAVPAWLVARSEITLQSGARYYFRTAPVDPADPFRGRYVTLAFDAAVLPPDLSFRAGERVWLPLRVGRDRYAYFSEALRAPPARGPYLAARVRWSGADQLRVELPFDRYYLDEALAPAAERAYRQASRARATLPAYVSVRIWRGNAVLEELFLDNVPLRRYLRR